MKLTHGAYILARFSTDNQEVDSIDVQVQKCREWCAREHLPVLDVFADEATSGMKDTRPEYSRMMRQLAEGGADTVVIYDQSRMFRKLTAWFQFREQVACYGVRVVAVTQPIIGGDLRDPMTFLSEGSMALMNQMWVLQTRQKVIEKMRYMAEQGKHTGGKPPLGYDVKDERLVINEDEAETVREIFRQYAYGKSYREIIKWLNDSGKRTKRGGCFGTNSLHDLLKNEKYIGNIVYGRSERRPDGTRNSHSFSVRTMRIENAVQAIIDRETWERVQKKMEDNRRVQAGRPPKAREYPLKGKVFCRECKSAMTIVSSKKTYYYYACSGKKRTGQCDNPQIGAGELENIVADAMREILGNPGNIENIISIIREEKNEIINVATQRMQILLARRMEINRQLEAGTNAILAGLHSHTLKTKMQELEEELAEIDRQMTTLKHSADGTQIPEDRLRALLNAAGDDVNALLSLVMRVEVGKDRIVVWTLLDADPNGHFDFSEDGINIDLQPVARRDENSGCPPTGTTWSQSLLCDHVFLCPWQKRRHPPAPLLLLCKLNPLYWASIFQTDIIRTRFFAGDGFGLFVYLGKCKRSASKTALPFISMSIRNQEHTGQERDRNQKIKARRKANMSGKGLAVLLRGRSHSCPPAPKPFFHCARGQRVCQNVIDWLAIIYRILQIDGIIKS